VTCDQVYAIVNTPESILMTGSVTSGTDANSVTCTADVSTAAASNFQSCPGALVFQDASGAITQSVPCNGRGLCDESSGRCECYTGYLGEECACPTGQEPDGEDPRICRLTATTVQSKAVVYSGVVNAAVNDPVEEIVQITTAPTTAPTDGTIETAKLSISMTLVNVNYDAVVWSDVKQAIALSLNNMLGETIHRRRLEHVTADMVKIVATSRLENEQVHVEFEVDMEKDQAEYLQAEISNTDSSSPFQSGVVAKLQEIAPTTYANAEVTVDGVTSTDTTPEEESEEESDSAEPGSSNGTSTVIIVACVVVVLVAAAVAVVMRGRLQISSAKEPQGKWKEQTAEEGKEARDLVEGVNPHRNTLQVLQSHGSGVDDEEEGDTAVL